jgi:hypothetical protein
MAICGRSDPVPLPQDGVGPLQCRDCKYQVCHHLPFNVPSVLTSTGRPIGWHGEGGKQKTGGHITVDFLSGNGAHITTHHIYPTEGVYGGTCIE